MNEVVFKRKFRWTLEGTLPGGKLEPAFVKVAARPNLNIEELEIDFLNTKMFVPGKTSWEQMTVTMWEIKDEVWKVLTPSFIEGPDFPPDDKLGTFKLTLYDGCGWPLEEWELSEAYICAARFCELDYSQSEVCDIEFDIRYKNAKYVANPRKDSLPSPYPYSPMGTMGIGCLGNTSDKVTCPKCSHEFIRGGIVF